MSNNKNNLIKLALDDSNHELDLSISDWDDLNELFKQSKQYDSIRFRIHSSCVTGDDCLIEKIGNQITHYPLNQLSNYNRARVVSFAENHSIINIPYVVNYKQTN
jgi:hypothetical protein